MKAIECKGSFNAILSYNDKSTEENIFVITGVPEPLLGRPAIERMNLIKNIDLLKEKQEVLLKFPKLFKGIGKLKESYHIKLKKEAAPFAIGAPRRIALQY